MNTKLLTKAESDSSKITTRQQSVNTTDDSTSSKDANNLLFQSVTAFGGIGGAALSVSLSYYFTKKKEVESSVNQKKIALYDSLLEHFLRWLNSKDQKVLTDFIVDYYRTTTYASSEVIAAIQKVIDAMESKNRPSGTTDEEDRVLIHSMLMAIRKDVNQKGPVPFFSTLSTYKKDES